MRWFRSNIRLGSRLALAALAVQFLLTFSHIDDCDLAPAGAKVVTLVMAGGSSAVAPDKNAPIRKSDRTADRTCPICALIQLAAASAPSSAPVLLPPTMLGRHRLEMPAAASVAASPPALFRARAPPFA
jgi:hypothetical protein